jgi:hypothetical protein
MEQGIRREILKMIQANTSDLRAYTKGLSGAAIDRVSGLATTGGSGSGSLPSATTAGSNLCAMFALVQPQQTGLYDVRISAAVTGISTGDSITWGIYTDYSVTNMPVITGGTSFGGTPSNGVIKVPVGLVAVTNQGVAGGVTYTNGHTGAPGVLMYTTGAQVSVTTALNQVFSFVGTVAPTVSATGKPTPLAALPAYMMIMLFTNISAGSATWQGLSIDIAERYGA